MSPPEVRLLGRLRGQALDGLKFRRQHPVDPYVLDFYCPELRLAVEVDGASHGLPGQAAQDVRRDAYLADKGIRTMRIAARDVMADLDQVMDRILATARM